MRFLNKILSNKTVIIIHVIIILLVGAYFVRFFYPTVNILVTPDVFLSDAWHDSYAKKYLLWDTLRTNTLPIWSALIGNGFPVLGEGLTGVLHPISLFLNYCVPPEYSLTLALFFNCILMGSGMFFWIKWRGGSNLAGLFAGITLPYSGISILQMTHIMPHSALAVIPWIFACTYQMVIHNTKIRWKILLSIAFAYQIYCGYPQIVFISLLMSTLYLIVLISFTPKKYALILHYLIVLIAALGLSSAQLLPSIEYQSQLTNPNGFSYETSSYFSFPKRHVLSFINPYIFGNPRDASYMSKKEIPGSIFWENTGFIGILPLLFIVFNIFSPSYREKKHIITDTCLLCVSGLLMMGKFSPLHSIYNYWPVTLFRVPSRFLWIFVIMLIMLAANGLGIFQRKIATVHLHTNHILGLLIILNTLHLFLVWNGYHLIEPFSAWSKKPKILQYINSANKIYSYGFDQIYHQTVSTIGWNQQSPYIDFNNALQANSNLIYHINSYSVYSGRVLKRTGEFDKLLQPTFVLNNNSVTIRPDGRKLLEIANVDTILTPYPIHDPSIFFVGSIPLTRFHVYVYRIQTIPEAYIGTDIKYSSSPEETQSIINNPSFIPGQSILIDDQRLLQYTQSQVLPSSIKITHVSDTQSDINISNPYSAALFVINRTYYPGWNAYIDNTITKIYPVNIYQQAILVPQGNHKVIFTYEPTSLRYGIYISLITLACINGYMLWIWKVKK